MLRERERDSDVMKKVLTNKVIVEYKDCSVVKNADALFDKYASEDRPLSVSCTEYCSMRN